MKEQLKQLLARRYVLPGSQALERAYERFSPAERFLCVVFAVFLVFGAARLVYSINARFLTEVPAVGGELRKGIIGSPRFLNPLLAISDADRDLTALIYSGLLRTTPEGALVPDLAERVDTDENGLTYTFHIREDATFHDGTPVTADDVLFTIQKAQDPTLKSPKRANWEGVSAEKKGEYEVTLTLKQPYAPFLENATLGILPRRLWKDVETEQFPFSSFNLSAVGSGPYRVTSVKRNALGIPLSIELSPFKNYALGAPYISRFIMRFYANEKELLAGFYRGEVESMNTVTPEAAKRLEGEGYRVERTLLPRIFGVFFNPNQSSLFAEKAVRQALELATDKETMVNTVLYGYGVPIDDPVPPLLLNTRRASATSTEVRLAEASMILEKAKWKQPEANGIREKAKGPPARGAQAGKETQKLSFSLATSDVPELREGAELLKAMWRRIGIETQVQIFGAGDLNQNVIRPRKFDALLFGEIIGRDFDLFAFWHSSQRNDPGLNIAMYTNSSVDKFLEEARRTTNPDKRGENYEKALAVIRNDAPAVFLYSPEFIYVLPQKVRGFARGRTTVPSERFLDVRHWYIETEKVWNSFNK